MSAKYYSQRPKIGQAFDMMRRLLFLIILALVALLLWQYVPPGTPPAFPPNLHLDRAAWMSIEWAMEPKTDDEILTLAADLRTHRFTDAFFYVSYLNPEGYFNPTYDHAADFTSRMRVYAPDIRLLAWVGVPITTTGSPNRLQSRAVRQQIAEFSAATITEMGFDGVHLNIEIVPDNDPALLETLRLVRQTLPAGAWLSTTANPLIFSENTTAFPAFILRNARHWSPEYLRQVAQLSDQVALMAYDSGLFFPRDYRTWMAYQVKTGTAALDGLETHFLIGLPVSEEWTPSHHVYTESLSNAVSGFREALTASTIDGIALYPYWEIDTAEWRMIDSLLPAEDSPPTN